MTEKSTEAAESEDPTYPQVPIDYPTARNKNPYYKLHENASYDRFSDENGLRLVGKQRLTFIFDRSVSADQAFKMSVPVPMINVGNGMMKAPIWAATSIAEFSAFYNINDHHVKTLEMMSFPFEFDMFRQTISVGCAMRFLDKDGKDTVYNEVGVDVEFWSPNL
jgi:hypothetical protein